MENKIMQYILNRERNKILAIGIFLLFIGFGGMIFSACFDLFKIGKPSFGLDQLAGLVIGGLIALTGLRKIVKHRSKIGDAFILIVYLAGILYMGLRADPNSTVKSIGVLQDTSFHFSDVAINFLGFLPLGYFMMTYLISGKENQRLVFLVVITVAICFAISFFIEYVQFYLPGRASSVVDLLFNGLGALCGSICCFIEVRIFR